MHEAHHGPPVDPSQRLDLALRQIVPEYHSRSAIVRWLFDKRVAVAADYVQAIGPAHLIDIGCGEGYFLDRLLRTGSRFQTAVGIDLNPNVVELNGRFSGCTFATGDVFRLDFPDGAFDAAVSLDVLEHIEDVRRAVVEIRRILREGGDLVTSEPVESVLYKSLRFVLKGTYSQESGPGAGKHYHNARQIDSIIRSMGFERLRSRKIPFHFPVDLFHVNLYRKRRA